MAAPANVTTLDLSGKFIQVSRISNRKPRPGI